MRKLIICCGIIEMILSAALLILLILKWIGCGGETGFEKERWALFSGVALLSLVINICNTAENNKKAAFHEPAKNSHER